MLAQELIFCPTFLCSSALSKRINTNQGFPFLTLFFAWVTFMKHSTQKSGTVTEGTQDFVNASYL
jgi:uncharacterized membrane protein